MYWVTSDLHLGHWKVAQTRGFESVTAHDEFLLNKWRYRVNSTNDVFVLGDLALGGWRDVLPKIKELPGIKHLVLGNHDRGHPSNGNGFRYLWEYASAFESVQTVATINYGGEKYMLSHFPYDGDHTEEERYAQWRLRDLGQPIIHGHTHSSARLSRSKLGTLQFHAGVDAHNFGPVPLRELVEERS